MTKKDASVRVPMDLSLNSRSNLRDNVTGDMIMEESRQQVAFRSEPEYEMMIAAYNILQDSKPSKDDDNSSHPVSGGFKAMQRVFRETNQNFEYNRVVKDIVEAIDFSDIQKHEDKIRSYAIRVGYAGGGNEVPMSELLDSEAKKQMRSVMGSATDVDSIVEHIQDLEEEESNGEAQNVNKKIDELEKKSEMNKPNLKLDNKREYDMSKPTRTMKRRSIATATPKQPAERTPQARNKTSKEDMKARRINEFSNMFQEIVGDIASTAASVEETRLKIIELTRMSVDNSTAEAACTLTILLNDIQKPLDAAYDVLVPDGLQEDDDFEDQEDYEEEDDLG